MGTYATLPDWGNSGDGAGFDEQNLVEACSASDVVGPFDTR
jgi:hypothetical protein